MPRKPIENRVLCFCLPRRRRNVINLRDNCSYRPFALLLSRVLQKIFLCCLGKIFRSHPLDKSNFAGALHLPFMAASMPPLGQMRNASCIAGLADGAGREARTSDALPVAPKIIARETAHYPVQTRKFLASGANKKQVCKQ